MKLTRLVLLFLTTALAPQSFGQVPSPRSGSGSLLVIGTRTAGPWRVPGVEGALLVDPLLVLPDAGTGSLERRLRRLRPGVPDAPLCGQEAVRDARSGRVTLSELVTLEPGAEPLDEVGARSPAASSEIQYPRQPEVEMTLTREPIHTIFTRYLSFRSWDGATKRLAIEFRRSAGLTWRAFAFPDGIGTLESLADTGNRSHWDTMLLENRGGSTELAIGRLVIRMKYDLSSNFEDTIPIVDRTLNRTLADGTSSISLDEYARLTRAAWAGITGSMHLAVRLAGRDLGKSGSDGADGYGANPKYGGRDDLLCSEFVSWYYHEAGLEVGGDDFRDVTNAETMNDLFSGDDLLYEYRNDLRRFVHMRTGAAYTPRAGDWLCRRGGGEFEHSMILLRWDDVGKEATVINGPWPVTLRTVPIQELETRAEDPKDFRIGRIVP